MSLVDMGGISGTLLFDNLVFYGNLYKWGCTKFDHFGLSKVCLICILFIYLIVNKFLYMMILTYKTSLYYYVFILKTYYNDTWQKEEGSTQ